MLIWSSLLAETYIIFILSVILVFRYHQDLGYMLQLTSGIVSQSARNWKNHLDTMLIHAPLLIATHIIFILYVILVFSIKFSVTSYNSLPLSPHNRRVIGKAIRYFINTLTSSIFEAFRRVAKSSLGLSSMQCLR